MRSTVHYLPIATTGIALVFALQVLRRHRERGGTHLLWWGIGLVTYAAGTATESLTTLFGWNEGVFRAWYITGALLGGAPLAQGSVYLLLKRPTANTLSILLVAAIVLAASCVLLTPIDYTLVEPYRLSGKVMAWRWVRSFSPFINLYAVTFLIGGAIVSAARYRRNPDTYQRYLGNIAIAVGAILPGIGGTFTRFGHTEVLYVTELVGLLLIYLGYRLSIARPRALRADAGAVAGVPVRLHASPPS
jgi:hypothetical protein